MTQKDFKRKLTAILSADIEGYSRLMGDDEEATVRTLTTYREIMTVLIQQHNGKVLDSPGDNLLAEFISVVDAVQCAVAVQKEIEARNGKLPKKRMMEYRIGINVGDVIQDQGRIYGDGVNIAARLEGLSDPGGICISKTAFDQIESKLPYGYDFLGDQPVKNIAKPVGAYRVLIGPSVAIAREHKKKISTKTNISESSIKKLDNSNDYYAGGIVCVACAIGLPIFGYFMEKIAVDIFFPMVGVGMLVGIIGIGLILWGMLLHHRNKVI